MQYLAVDIETFGLDPDHHDIVEFAAVLVDTDYPRPIEELPSCVMFVSPNGRKGYRADPAAMVMHNKNGLLEDLLNPARTQLLVRPYELGITVARWLADQKPEPSDNRLVLAGKNLGSFDLQFLKKQTDWDAYMHVCDHRIIDVGSIYLSLNDHSPPSMEDCLQRAGFRDRVTQHRALPDAQDVVRCVSNLYDYPRSPKLSR